MSVAKITFVGPAALALRVATALADAEGVELVSSGAPLPHGDGLVALDVTAEGSLRDVAAAVDRVRATLPAGARLDVDG